VLSAFQEVQDNITRAGSAAQCARIASASGGRLTPATGHCNLALCGRPGELPGRRVNAQQNLLSNEQEAAIIHGQRLVTAVAPRQALGGGWDAASIAAVQEKAHLKDIVAP